MTPRLNELLRDYGAALNDYLQGDGEHALRRGYELGRQALSQGLGVLDITAVYQELMAGEDRGMPAVSPEAATKALNFLAESLSPCEMVLRGLRESDGRVRQ